MAVEKEVDWKRVEKMAMCGCTCFATSQEVGIHEDTLHYKVKEKYGIVWSAFTAKYREKGAAHIKEKQYDKAIDGDNSMLIWVGKNLCGQSDNPQELALSANAIEQFKSIMLQVKTNQDSLLIKADNNINKEEKS
jgi:hypothetical protein